VKKATFKQKMSFVNIQKDRHVSVFKILENHFGLSKTLDKKKERKKTQSILKQKT
jgi:hypothetical protein